MPSKYLQAFVFGILLIFFVKSKKGVLRNKRWGTYNPYLPFFYQTHTTKKNKSSSKQVIIPHKNALKGEGRLGTSRSGARADRFWATGPRRRSPSKPC